MKIEIISVFFNKKKYRNAEECIHEIVKAYVATDED
jgi:hypothetical protein